ncbi:hypothetical protein [Luteolibacter sp. Populi]|uniref:hypothetical protein n=1 Tax=Luteolibacter sp. Populi TaxID=3230487 RepID=UPI003466D48F
MSRAPNEIPPWRECPFTPGRSYRVLKDFTALRDSFKAGQVLTYSSDAWSRYDGITGYFFVERGAGLSRVWDIDDGDDIGIWKELFEELPDRTGKRN